MRSEALGHMIMRYISIIMIIISRAAPPAFTTKAKLHVRVLTFNLVFWSVFAVTLYLLRRALLKRMQRAVFLLAVVAAATAFDFPECWEAWKSVSVVTAYILAVATVLY